MKYLHTMVRVSDLERSLDFYCNKLGLVETRRYDSEQGRFTLVFLSAPEDLDDASLQEIWSWGMQHWHIEALAGRTRVTVDSSAMAEGKNGLL